MTNQSIQSLLSRELYTGGADIITHRTLTEILKLNNECDGSDQWRNQIVAVSDMLYELSNGLSVLHVVVLAIIEDHWESLDVSWRMAYNNDFLAFCYQKYQRKPSTIRADLRAVRTFLLGNSAVVPFGTIEMPKRNQAGLIEKDDTGKIITEQVEWDVTKTTLPKLKLAVPLLEQGKMDDKTWSMLMDDHISSSQMYQKVSETHENDTHPLQMEIRFRLEGPMLVAYENGNESVLGELDFSTYYDEPYSLKHRAMDRLLAQLGLTLDEHVTLYRRTEDTNNDYYNDH